MYPARDTGERGRRSHLLLAASMVVAFLVQHATEISWLQHLIDEGQNLYAARLIDDGQVPFRDYFYHQPPLYLYVLALLPTDHFVYGRAVSLLAAAVAGLVLFAIGRRAFGAASRLPLLVLALYLFASLQYWNLLAIPNACMLLLGVLGAWLALARSDGRRPVIGAGICLALSIVFKPLTLALYPAIVWSLAADPGLRRRIVPLTAAIAATGVAAFGALHLGTDGAFTEVVRLHASRFVRRPTLEAFGELPGLRGMLGDKSGLAFTIEAHAGTFFGWSLDALLLLGGLLGARLAWRGLAGLRPADRVLWPAWLAFALLFSLVVWDVAYEHYHVLYLPPLCLLTAVWLRRVAAAGPWRRRAVAVVVVAYVATNVVSIHIRRQDYQPAIALRGETAPVMAFDPLVNVLSRTRVPCGMIAFPLPPYLRHLDGERPGFDASVTGLMECLDASPEVKIVIHHLSGLAFTLFDERLYDFILRQDPGRVLFLSDPVRQAFLDLYAPGGGGMRQGDPRLLAPRLP